MLSHALCVRVCVFGSWEVCLSRNIAYALVLHVSCCLSSAQSRCSLSLFTDVRLSVSSFLYSRCGIKGVILLERWVSAALPFIGFVWKLAKEESEIQLATYVSVCWLLKEDDATRSVREREKGWERESERKKRERDTKAYWSQAFARKDYLCRPCDGAAFSIPLLKGIVKKLSTLI